MKKKTHTKRDFLKFRLMADRESYIRLGNIRSRNDGPYFVVDGAKLQSQQTNQGDEYR